jgi:hypothetical protein
MMQSNTYLLLERLILKGVTKDYEATFKEGLNIVWGDMDSGKSSILNLVDYCFGGSNDSLRYAEIAANARIVYLQVDLNGTRVTIERDLTDPNAAVRVYSGSYSEVGETFPRLMGASSSAQMPDGWLSDFILECLSIPRVKIKQSKRDEASADRLSIRDLFKLMYLKQTRVGSDNLLDYANPSLFVKNTEVQKFVYNVHNEALTTLRGELSEIAGERKNLLSERDSVRNFLASVNIKIGDEDANFEQQLTLKDEELSFLTDAIQKLRDDFKLSSSVATELKARLTELRIRYDRVLSDIQETESKKASYIQLRNTYKLDLENLNLARHGKAVLVQANRGLTPISCPLCETPLAISPADISDEELATSTKSYKNRLAGVDEAIAHLLKKHQTLQEEADSINAALIAQTTAYDQDNFAEVSGLLKSIETLEAGRTQLKTEVATLHNTVSIRRRFQDIERSIEHKDATVERIKRSINDIEEGATSLDEVQSVLSGSLSKRMQASGVRNVHGVYVDEKFVPYFRDLSYYKSTSGGVRTVLSIASFLARMDYLIKKGGNLPTFLMIDTPGQNIGRNHRRDEENIDEEFSDPMIYEKVYAGIIDMLKIGLEHDRRCQVIVVDNDLPKILSASESFHLVKRFSKSSKNFPSGLIDDASNA